VNVRKAISDSLLGAQLAQPWQILGPSTSHSVDNSIQRRLRRARRARVSCITVAVPQPMSSNSGAPDRGRGRSAHSRHPRRTDHRIATVDQGGRSLTQIFRRQHRTVAADQHAGAPRSERIPARVPCAFPGCLPPAAASSGQIAWHTPQKTHPAYPACTKARPAHRRRQGGAQCARHQLPMQFCASPLPSAGVKRVFTRPG